MEAFTSHTGIGVPLRRSNVDTDQIIPAVYLKRVTRTGFEDGLFAAWRNDPSFVLNQPAVRRGLGARRRPRLRHRLVARARRVGLQNYGFRVVHLAALRRHLPRQLRQGRTARGAGRRQGRAAALGPARGRARARRSPSTSSRARCAPATGPTRSRTPSTSTTTPAGGCSRVSTTSASRSPTRPTSRRTKRRGRPGSPSRSDASRESRSTKGIPSPIGDADRTTRGCSSIDVAGAVRRERRG